MIYQQIYTEEESEEEALSFIVKEIGTGPQEESEYKILSLIVKEAKAEPQSLQELFKALQIHTNIKGYNGEPVKDAKYYVDNLGIPHLSHLKQKA